MARSISGSANDHVTSNSNLTIPTSFAISVWATTTFPNSFSGNSTAYSIGDSVNNDFQVDALFSNKTLSWLLNGTPSGGTGGSAVLTAGTWYHLAANINFGTSLTSTGYVNGTLDATATRTASLATTSTKLNGGNGGGLGTPLGGNIADLAFWNINLSTAEISALAKGERPYRIRPASLVSWWPLDGLQSPEPDLSGNANNGVLTGTGLAFGPPIVPVSPRVAALLSLPTALPIIDSAGISIFRLGDDQWAW